jgi:hypothetical protein
MQAPVLCTAFFLLFSTFVFAGPRPTSGTENIPELMTDSTLVCKGEVVEAPETIAAPNPPTPRRTATAVVHVDRCFKGERPASEMVPVLFDNILPGGGTSLGRMYAVLRKGDYCLYFLKPEGDKYVLVDDWFGKLSISRHLASDSAEDSDPMHQLESDLKAGLTDPERDRVLDSIRMLGNMRHLQSKSVLISLLDSPDALVRTYVYEAMLRLHDYSDLPAVERWLMAQPSPPAALFLPRDSLFLMQYKLVSEISAIRDPSYLRTMDGLLRLPSPNMRRDILQGIRSIHSLQSAPTFLRMLDDPDTDIGFIAMQALFELAGGGPIDWVPSFEQFRDNRTYYAATCREWWQANHSQKE